MNRKPKERTKLYRTNRRFWQYPESAFDIEGKRMGYGGGYYDTYIEKYDVKNTVALAFDMQIKESIPTEKHDKAMKLIITEKSIIGGKGNEQID